MTVVIGLTSDGRRIRAEGATASRANQVIGANFRKAARDFTFPLTLDTCYELREVFGYRMQVEQPLSDWARAEMDRADAMEAARDERSIPSLPRVSALAPDLAKAILARRYQAQGARWMLEGSHTLLGDEPGLGKTLQGLAVLIESGAKRILVTCPKTATYTTWERLTRRWAPTIFIYRAQGSWTNRRAELEAFLDDTENSEDVDQHMLIINTEMMRVIRERCPDHGKLKDCHERVDRTKRGEGHKHEYNITQWPELSEEITWDAVVIDESHNALAGVANTRSKNVTQVRYGAMSIRRSLAQDGIAIAMSGTPFRSKLTKSWGTLNWLEPQRFTSFWNFAEKHFGADWAEGKKAAPEPLDIDAFHAEMRGYYLARTKADVAPDLPPITYAGVPSEDNPDGPVAVWVDMGEEQQRLYEEMRDWARVRLENGEVTATGVLAELTRLRQFACSSARLGEDGEKDEHVVYPIQPSCKLEWIQEFMLEREDTPAKVVIASSFTRLINLYAAALKPYSPLVITGNTTQRNRELAVELFQDDPSRKLLIINSFAGGESITVDAADELIFVDLPWTSDQAKQVEARIHRVSRIHNVIVYRLLVPGTVEEKINNITQEQRTILEAASPKSVEVALDLI
jgi:SNF2 family DNA or RNA helicase